MILKKQYAQYRNKLMRYNCGFYDTLRSYNYTCIDIHTYILKQKKWLKCSGEEIKLLLGTDFGKDIFIINWQFFIVNLLFLSFNKCFSIKKTVNYFLKYIIKLLREKFSMPL